jgi:N-acetylglucosaminyldiphosphoundecaprenol N-acetyl-beta-D-mannosaminyltransferase
MIRPFNFGGLSLMPFDVDTAAGWIVARAEEGHACLVVTSNIHHLRLMQRDRAFRDIVSRAELNVADGWPLVLANRLVRRAPRLPERVAGVDLVSAVLAGQPRLRLAILGGAPGAAEIFAKQARSAHDVVLVDPLTPGAWEHPPAIERLSANLREERPNLVLIAIGAPRQELLGSILLPVVRGPIICCGASVEILAGLRRRAPRPIQAAGLEWAFRAALEPSRLLPRYAVSVPVYLKVLARELTHKPSSEDRLPA